MKTSRRKFIQNTSKASVASLLVPSTSFTILKSRPKLDNEILGHGDLTYRLEKDWGSLDSSKTPVNDCHEMVQDTKGRIILLTNEIKNNIIIYDKSGKLLDVWSKQYRGAHGLTLSKEGEEDFLFITDLASHKVYKTTLDGQEIMRLDYPRESGLYLEENQYFPTETAIAPNGDIYVTDGYGLQYIFHYDSKAQLKNVFGGLGSEPHQFSARWTAHGICIDGRNNTEPTLIIADRNSNQFKRFTMDGKYISTIAVPGAFVSRPVIKGDYLYTAVLNSEHPWSVSDSGFVSILDKNDRVVSNPAANEPVYTDGKLQRLQQTHKVFRHPHDVCIDEDENLYIAQWNSGKTYPLKLIRV
jgi:hypothetical protein